MSIIVRLNVPVMLSCPDVPDIFLSEIDGTRIPISVSYSGNIFTGNASASITYFEPAKLVGKLMPWDFGGKWTLTINDIVCFKGFVANMHSERTVGDGYIRNITFSGLMKGWDVTCAAKIFPVGATEENPSNTYTASDALADLVEIVSDGSMSGIHLDGVIPSTPVLIRDMYQEKVLTITNSTYLAEIQRLAMYLGCAVFQHPSHDTIAIVDILHPVDKISSNFQRERCSRAAFDVNFETIPGTVLVVDDVTQIADSYGYLGAVVHATNYNFTGRNDIVYASTVGIAKEHLITIAEQLWKIGRFGSQVLHFKYAGLEPDPEMLGKWFDWTDPVGGTGNYVVNSFTTTYKRTSIWTEIEAYLKPSV